MWKRTGHTPHVTVILIAEKGAGTRSGVLAPMRASAAVAGLCHVNVVPLVVKAWVHDIQMTVIIIR